jgi:hypothetical protein
MILLPIGPVIVPLAMGLIFLVSGSRRNRTNELGLGAVLLGLAIVAFGYSIFAIQTMQDVPPFYHGTFMDEVQLTVTMGGGVALVVLGIAGWRLSVPFWQLLLGSAH